LLTGSDDGELPATDKLSLFVSLGDSGRAASHGNAIDSWFKQAMDSFAKASPHISPLGATVQLRQEAWLIYENAIHVALRLI
jgi:hypothetical protein